MDKTIQNCTERCFFLIRSGGLIAVDGNVLWEAASSSRKTGYRHRLYSHFNEQLLRDERVDISLIPIGDGLTLARKR